MGTDTPVGIMAELKLQALVGADGSAKMNAAF
jgi:hypothetical protein